MIVSIVVTLVGLANLWLARRFNAPFLTGASVLLAVGGALLLVIQLIPIRTSMPLFFGVFGLFGLAMGFCVVSILKRELRASMRP